MPDSMKISKYKFEEEMQSLLNAAKSAGNVDTARGYLKEAKSKMDGYYNITSSLKQQYLREIEDVADELGISI